MAFGRGKRSAISGREAKMLAARYRAAEDAGDDDEAEAALWRLSQVAPGVAWVWFDLGLRAKWRRDWSECVRLNTQALALETSTDEDPAAWNLGIAATALSDWVLARRGWTAYGIDLPDGAGEPRMELGPVPIRLNPEPRHPGETQLEIEGEGFATEVVWCRRIDPARAVIVNVPTAESGHRFGDHVLHDGEPLGTRTVEGEQRDVFNELALLQRSELPTLAVEVFCPNREDSDALQELVNDTDYAAEDWTGGVRVLCKACSEGNPDPKHDHGTDEWIPDRYFGIAAHVADAERLLAHWASTSSDRRYDEPERVL